MSPTIPHIPNRAASVQVGLPQMVDRLSSALRGAYRRDLEVPDDMSALLLEIDRRTHR